MNARKKRVMPKKVNFSKSKLSEIESMIDKEGLNANVR